MPNPSLGTRTRLYARYAARDPRFAFALLSRNSDRINDMRVKRLSRLLGVPSPQVETALDDYQDTFDRLEAELKGRNAGNDLRSMFIPDIYTIVRLLKPKLIVETGVFSGYSSAFILAALSLNQSGKLFSIDLPDADPSAKLPAGKEPGWAVPPSLRDRWNLLLGDSKGLLPPLLKDLGHVDVFFHDSLHTYQNMMFEFTSAWPYLGRGGILLSDNVVLNEAFFHFSKTINQDPTLLWRLTPRRDCFGIIRKPLQANSV